MFLNCVWIIKLQFSIKSLIKTVRSFHTNVSLSSLDYRGVMFSYIITILEFFISITQLVNISQYPPQIQHLCQRIKRDFVSAPVTASRSQILEQLLSELSTLSKGMLV